MHLIKSIQETKASYYPTKEGTIMWFHIINRYVFDTQLTPFENIVIKRMNNWWACVRHDDEIKLPLDLDLHMKFPNKLHFVNVLAHEMVHKWQLEINRDTGWHNKHFYSWRPKFLENGLILTRKS